MGIEGSGVPRGGGRGAWPLGASLGGGAGPACIGRVLKRKLGLGK